MRPKSTKELQLASLDFCMACRSVPRLYVKAEHGTPTRLWMGAPARQTRRAKRLSSTRVPVIRADGVAWKLSASALRRMGDVLSKVKRFCLHGAPNAPAGSPDAQAGGFMKEEVGNAFNQPITDIAWPASLQHITFYGAFTQPLQGVPWPVSLQTLRFDTVTTPLAGVS